MGLSVIVITKNEAKDLPRALNSVSFADEVIVLDSGSIDDTKKIAQSWGAKVYETKDWPGFGIQKNRALDKATQDWVLSIDADEWIESGLALKIREVVEGDSSRRRQFSADAFRIRRKSIFIDRVIRFGDWRRDTVVRLFRRAAARFSDDLVHERLIVDGSIQDLEGFIGHYSVRSIEDSRSKMWQYNRLAALKIAREGRGSSIKGFFKGVFSIFRGLVIRLGILDGIRGVQLAWFNAYGAYLRYSLAQSIQDQNAYRDLNQSTLQRFRDVLQLVFVDHGFLRGLYHNRFRLAGGLYRTNQPSPKRLTYYQRKYGIKTVINLRGENEQLGWYRLEQQACKLLGLKFISIQIYSRGLVDAQQLKEIRRIIQSVELPALVHCKSGADRAGFFSVLYRHYRLGEPIEAALSELGSLYGHFKSAKTGILDFFFQTYLQERGLRQAFERWVNYQFSREILQSKFRHKGFATWFVDRLLGRE